VFSNAISSDSMWSTILTFVNIVVISGCGWLFVDYWSEKKAVKQFAVRAVGNNKQSLLAVLLVAGEIFKSIKAIPCNDDPHFISLPGLSSLGATPGSVLQRGGCCSGLARLNIVSLDALGYKAAQITVCHDSGEAQHCLLEVSLPSANVLIDPTYGIYYVDELGREIGLSDLHAGVRPSFASLPHSNAHGYPSGRYYDFDYRKTKTANWTKSWTRKALYRALFLLTKGAVDSLKQPVALEWPQAILACSMALTLIILNMAILICSK
jgi:hypothetical protein